jgi:hypothetical protein
MATVKHRKVGRKPTAMEFENPEVISPLRPLC